MKQRIYINFITLIYHFNIQSPLHIVSLIITYLRLFLMLEDHDLQYSFQIMDLVTCGTWFLSIETSLKNYFMFTLNHTVRPLINYQDQFYLLITKHCFINKKNKSASQSDFVFDARRKKISIVSKGKFLTFLS